jgi:cysteine sulfinate desulfinase/cysteine desulfurase-like protein
MLANNEIGTIQPVREISRIIQEFKKQKPKRIFPDTRIFILMRARQANYLDLSFPKITAWI